MGIDIKFPIGLMFMILGFILTAYGLFTSSDVELYRPSLGININLWSGAGMLIFGFVMLFMAWKTNKNKTT